MIPVDHVVVILLITARLVGLVMIAPFFNNEKLFMSPLKVSFLVFLAALISVIIPLPSVFPSTWLTVAVAALLELVIGFSIGFLMQVLVAGVELAGFLIDTQAGISAAALFDPLRGDQVTIIAGVYRRLAVLVFILLDGHHMLLLALRSTFDIIPVGMGHMMRASQFAYMSQFGSIIFEIGWRFSAPVLIIIFFVDFGFGMLSRVASQVNVFQLSFQLKPIVMLSIVMLIIPLFIDNMADLITRVPTMVGEFLGIAQ